MEPVVDDLERRTVADALVANHAALVQAECRELVLAAQWADLHPAESIGSGGSGVVLPGTERRSGTAGTAPRARGSSRPPSSACCWAAPMSRPRR